MPQLDYYITARAVQPVLAGLVALEHDVKSIAEAVGIEYDAIDDPDGRIPHSTMMMLWRRAEEVTGDDHLGLHLAQAAPITSFEVHAYAVLSSPTLRDAYRRACRYQRLIHEVTNLTFEEEEEQGVLRHALPTGRAIARHPAEFLVALWVRFGRLVTGTDWAPDAVYFSHPDPGDHTEHERFFRSPVTFATGMTAVQIPNRILDLPNPGADCALISVLDRYAQMRLERTPRRSTLSESARCFLIDALADGAPSTQTLAGALHMSVRTLHRRLQAEGTSYRELLEAARHERATALLADRRYSIAEVAFMLGFSEVASFYKSFRRWTGTTPLGFRENLTGTSHL